MQTITDISQKKFCQAQKILSQRDIKLINFPSVPEVLKDRTFSMEEIQGPVIIISKAGHIYSLDWVGAFIWDLLKENLNVHEIALRVIEVFDVSTEEAILSTSKFLMELVQLGLAIECV